VSRRRPNGRAAGRYASRARIDSTVITANPATIAPATSGTFDGASAHVVVTLIRTDAPSTTSGMTPSWMR
jgi:hypothetical protein